MKVTCRKQFVELNDGLYSTLSKAGTPFETTWTNPDGEDETIIALFLRNVDHNDDLFDFVDGTINIRNEITHAAYDGLFYAIDLETGLVFRLRRGSEICPLPESVLEYGS